MTKENNKDVMSKQLIKEFQQLFYEKIGYIPIIYDINNEKDKFINLKKLESIINYYIPEKVSLKYKAHSVKCNCRAVMLCDLRNIFCHIAYSIGYKLGEIGYYLNNRDHSTIINSLKKCNSLLKYDETYSNLYNIILHNVNKNINNGNELLYFTNEESIDSKSTLSLVLL